MIHKIIPLEDGYENRQSQGSSTRPGYTVEARLDLLSPVNIGRQTFDKKWRQVEFDQSAIRVPMSHVHHRELLEHGLFSYAAAQALRWWFHAQAEIECFGASHGLQTRLVLHQLTLEHEISAIGVVDD